MQITWRLIDQTIFRRSFAFQILMCSLLKLLFVFKFFKTKALKQSFCMKAFIETQKTDKRTTNFLKIPYFCLVIFSSVLFTFKVMSAPQPFFLTTSLRHCVFCVPSQNLPNVYKTSNDKVGFATNLKCQMKKMNNSNFSRMLNKILFLI
jgi:hypothetical protein